MTLYTKKTIFAALWFAFGALLATATPLKFQGADGGTITTYTMADNAVFSLISDDVATGTGIFPSFLRVSTPNGNTFLEQGYNTENNPPQVYDETNGHTINVPWSQLGTWTENSTDYYRFLLDWNEPNGGASPALSLLDLRIYSGIANLNSHIDQPGFTSNTTLLWNLAASFGNSGYDQMWFVDVNHGSGRGDLNILIPKSLISVPSGQPNFILYAKLGQVNRTDFGAAQGTFEEFSYYAGGTDPLPPDVPEPVTFALLGVGLTVLCLARRFRS